MKHLFALRESVILCSSFNAKIPSRSDKNCCSCRDHTYLFSSSEAHSLFVCFFCVFCGVFKAQIAIVTACYLHEIKGSDWSRNAKANWKCFPLDLDKTDTQEIRWENVFLFVFSFSFLTQRQHFCRGHSQHQLLPVLALNVNLIY